MMGAGDLKQSQELERRGVFCVALAGGPLAAQLSPVDYDSAWGNSLFVRGIAEIKIAV